MRIGLDATPLLGPRTGIGRYAAELFTALPSALGATDQLLATAFTFRGRNALDEALPRSVSIRSRPAPARLLRAVWSRSELLPLQLLTGDVDVFHGVNFVLPPTGSAAGVVTVHDLAHLRFPATVDRATRALTALVPRSMHRAQAVCVPSHAVADELLERWPDAQQKINVTPLGVGSAWLAPHPPDSTWLRSRGLTRPYVIFAGSIQPRKGLSTIVDAIRLLRARHITPPILALAGPAGWGAALDVSGLDEGDVVRLGALSDPELMMAVGAAESLVYPSVYEGFGLPLLEAFACGTHVIASDIPSTREVLGDAADLASMFPVNDHAAAADLLATVGLEAPSAPEARRDHAAAHSWAVTARATAMAYDRALRQRQVER